jgi:hypothetical protein
VAEQNETDAPAAAATSTTCEPDLVGLGRPLALQPDGGRELLDGTRERVAVGSARVGVRMLDSAVDLYWHTRQLHRIGAGREPRPRESAARTLAALLFDNGWGAARRRRGG